jgi:hypothetical protein
LTLFGYSADPEAIPPRHKRPVPMFRSGQLRRMIYDVMREKPEASTCRAIAAEIVFRMGWDAFNVQLVKVIARSVRKVRARIKRAA